MESLASVSYFKSTLYKQYNLTLKSTFDQDNLYTWKTKCPNVPKTIMLLLGASVVQLSKRAPSGCLPATVVKGL